MSETDVVPTLPQVARTPLSPPATVPAPSETVPAPSNGMRPSPFRSADIFNAYCEQVQLRLKEHAVRRADFLQGAYERLNRLVQTAKAVEDTDLYEELLQYRAAARELLTVLNQVTGSARPLPEAVTREIERPMPPMGGPSYSAPPSHPMGGSSYVPSGPPPIMGRPYPTALTPPGATPGVEPPPIQRMPRRPSRPIADIEEDAKRLRAEVAQWQDDWPLTRSRGELHIPNCLRLRALACRQRKLEEEGGDNEIAEVVALAEDIDALRDGAGDDEYTVAIDYELEQPPSAYQWGELAERYEEMARAQEAYEWWQQRQHDLTPTEAYPMVEAIAAVQQRFNRLLFRVGARDPFQQQLFDDLRTWAREAQQYLSSLRPKVPMQELVDRAMTLEDAWDQARIPVQVAQQRQQVIENLIRLVSEPNFGQDPDNDERRLRDALGQCKDLRVPASERRLRDALLPWAAFLEGDERFKDVLREINLEWERRQDIGKAEEVEEEPANILDTISDELAAVREVTRGKRCLLLGGTCREDSRRKIEEALELSELVWPSTKPSDPLSKFDTEIRHSDIVALLTRFSRKEWKNAQDICAREGKKFVHLTTGYGVAQVVRHFYMQIAPQAANKS